MSAFSDRFARAFQALLPSPFAIAVVLTAIAAVLALVWGDQSHPADVLENWTTGLWNPGLLVFAFQMMLMLVLGHILALTRPAERLISAVSRAILVSNGTAAAFVALATMLTGFFNWGFGLIFGAILARKVGEEASRRGIPINYPLIGAAGYTGLLVWHGGLSGSSLVKVAEEGHLASLLSGVIPPEEIAQLPVAIPVSDTVFSAMNLIAAAILLLAIPLYFYLSGKRKVQQVRISAGEPLMTNEEEPGKGAEQLDVRKWLGGLFGVFFLAGALLAIIRHSEPATLGWMNPNWINTFLFGMCLLLHGSIRRFLRALEQAITGAAGILVQFPLYFGIMGIITGSGLIHSFSETMVAISTSTTYPVFTFFSAAIVNVFVPSGGGQWAVQGAIIIKSSMAMDIPLHKSILALAYGDQVTNMLQPFWALPLLGITGLKAKQILPYTLGAMFIASFIFVALLLLF